MAADIFEDAERRMRKAVDALRQDLTAIRTGRASASLVDRIQVDRHPLTRFHRLAFLKRV
jgi:ribosome recycling factor